MLRRISVEDIKKRKRDEDDSTDKTDSFSDEDEPAPKKARRAEKTEPLDLLAQLSAQRSDDKQPMTSVPNPAYMAMPQHPMAMAMRYPPPPVDMKMPPGAQFPTDEKGNNILPPLSVLTNHLPPSSMPVGYPYPPQMYAYPMYYMQGAAPFMPYFPNAPVRNFM